MWFAHQNDSTCRDKYESVCVVVCCHIGVGTYLHVVYLYPSMCKCIYPTRIDKTLKSPGVLLVMLCLGGCGYLWSVVGVLCGILCLSDASYGDRHHVYRHCLKSCEWVCVVEEKRESIPTEDTLSVRYVLHSHIHRYRAWCVWLAK